MRYRSLLTVVTPASDYALVDLATVRDELGILDSTTDTRLTRWTLEEGADIEAVIGRKMRAEALSETFRSDGRRSYDAPGEHFYPNHNYSMDVQASALRLTRYPIVSVTSITEDGVVLDPAVDYEIDAQAGLIYRLAGTVRTSWFGQLVVVAYTGGYATTADVPADLRKACLLLLRHRQAAGNRDPMLRQINIPGVAEQQFWVGAPTGEQTGLPPEVESLVLHYRDMRL